MTPVSPSSIHSLLVRLRGAHPSVLRNGLGRGINGGLGGAGSTCGGASAIVSILSRRGSDHDYHDDDG